MKSISSICRAMVVLFVLTAAFQLAGQNTQNPGKHHRYKLIDLGSFGGPASYFSNGADGILNNRGTAAGWADTSTPDPYSQLCFNPDCFVSHAFQWQNGVLTDLGALPGGANSQSTWIGPTGLIAGLSQNGEIDPLMSPFLGTDFPEIRAVFWQKGQMTDLGTLDGGYESQANAVNSEGQAVGWSLNLIPDSFSLNCPGFCTTETRAFVWEGGAMRDLGTLGGDDAFAQFVNEHGQITGYSYTNTTPNLTTGLPTADPFFWEKDQMVDIGSLGGTFGYPAALNNRGQVVGISNTAGDLTSHPFLWSEKTGLLDLGTLGGNSGVTNWINDTGDIAGKADLPGPLPQNHDAVLWTNNGREMIDLGVLPGDSCANAYYVNSRGQVVGTSENSDLCKIPTGEHAFLWEKGGPMINLNSLIPTDSDLELTFAFAINDRGEIVGVGSLPNGDSHAFVLIPCDENHSRVEGCDYSMVDVNANAGRPETRVELPQVHHGLLQRHNWFLFPSRGPRTE